MRGPLIARDPGILGRGRPIEKWRRWVVLGLYFRPRRQSGSLYVFGSPWAPPPRRGTMHATCIVLAGSSLLAVLISAPVRLESAGFNCAQSETGERERVRRLILASLA